MDSIDSYSSILVEIKSGKGKDKKGEYKLMELIREVPCDCHPETCTHFSGKTLRATCYKLYKDGTKVSVPYN